MRMIWNKGHRIRASDKHLVYHFSIGTLLFVFMAVLLLLNIIYTLGGNDVLVKLPAIPMPPLFMEQILRFMIGLVKKFIDFQRDLHGHSLSVIIDGNFHLPFLHSDFLGKSAWGGGERHRG